MLIGGGIAGRTGNNAARELSMEEISSYFESIKMTTIEEYKAGANSSDPMYVVKFPKGQQYVAGSSSEALGLIFQMMQWEVNYKNAVIDSYFNGNNAVVPKSTNLSGSASPTVINPAENLPAVLGKGSTPIVPVSPTSVAPVNPTNPTPTSPVTSNFVPTTEQAVILPTETLISDFRVKFFKIDAYTQEIAVEYAKINKELHAKRLAKYGSPDFKLPEPKVVSRSEYKAAYDVQNEMGEYYSLQEKMRAGKPLNNAEQSFYDRITGEMKPTKESITLWRSINVYPGFEEEIRSGKLHLHGLTSTCAEYGNFFAFWGHFIPEEQNDGITISPNYILKINVPKGYPILDCNIVRKGILGKKHYTRIRSEVVLPDCEVKVTNIDDELNVIEVEIIPKDSSKTSETLNSENTFAQNKTGSTGNDDIVIKDIPDGYYYDKKTKTLTKVDKDKVRIHRDGDEESGRLTLYDEEGNLIGSIAYELQNNGQDLDFMNLSTAVNGLGLGRMLVEEVIKIGKESGKNITATANVGWNGLGINKKATNLGFYYKMGFRATDKGVDKLIQQYIKEGKEIPPSLNQSVKIKYVGKPFVGKSTGKPEAKTEKYTPESVEAELKKYLKNDKYDINIQYKCLFENLDKFDYENMETHLKHIKKLIDFEFGNYKYAIIKNGYFSSKEGAEAFEYFAKKFPTPPTKGIVSDLERVLGDFGVKHFENARKRGLLDQITPENVEKINLLASYSDNQYSIHKEFQEKNVNYVSNNNDINRLLLKLGVNKPSWLLESVDEKLSSLNDHAKITQAVDILLALDDVALLDIIYTTTDIEFLINHANEVLALDKIFDNGANAKIPDPREQGYCYGKAEATVNIYKQPELAKEILDVAKKGKFSDNEIFEIAVIMNEKSCDFIKNLTSDESLTSEQVMKLIRNTELIFARFDVQLSDELELYNTLSSMTADEVKICKDHGLDIAPKLAELTEKFDKNIGIISAPKEQVQRFNVSILANNSRKAEAILKTADFAKYGETGIPLKYTREQFNKRINEILSQLNEAEQKEVLKHFGLERGAVGGFDGLPNNAAYETSDSRIAKVAEQVKAEIEKFTLENDVVSKDSEFKAVMNDLIKGFPEFALFIGKPQHGTHAYTVDVHTLKVLQNAMNNPMYSTLNDIDKTVLKLAILMHDFGKNEGVVDSGHEYESTDYAVAILERYPFPADVKRKITDVVSNHHWFAKFNQGQADATDIALMCRENGMFKIMQIMAKADLESVNDEFQYEKTGTKTKKAYDRFMADKFAQVDAARKDINKYSALFYNSRLVVRGKYPKQTLIANGKETQIGVLNTNELQPGTPMEQFGYAPGVTSDNLVQVAHYTDDASTLETVLKLCKNPHRVSEFSAGVFRLQDSNSFVGREICVIFDYNQAQMIDGANHSLQSGYQKGIEDIKQHFDITERFDDVEFKKIIIKTLRSHFIILNDGGYAKLCEYLFDNKYITQIKDGIRINGRLISQNVIQECNQAITDYLMSESQDIGNYTTEVRVKDPIPVAIGIQAESLEEVPQWFIDLADKYGLGIQLLKKNPGNYGRTSLLNTVNSTQNQAQSRPQAQAKTETLDEVKAGLDSAKESYEILSDKDGNTLIKVVSSYTRENPAAGIDFKYNVFKFDKKGTLVETHEDITPKDIKETFGKTKSVQIVDNSDGSASGQVYIKIPSIGKTLGNLFGKNKSIKTSGPTTGITQSTEAGTTRNIPNTGTQSTVAETGSDTPRLKGLTHAAQLASAKNQLKAMTNYYGHRLFSDEDVEKLAEYYLQNSEAVTAVTKRYNWDCFQGADEVDLAIQNVKTNGLVIELAKMQRTTSSSEIVSRFNGKQILDLVELNEQTEGLAMEFARIPYEVLKDGTPIGGYALMDIDILCKLATKYGKENVLKCAKITHIGTYGSPCMTYYSTNEISKILSLEVLYGEDIIFEIASKTSADYGLLTELAEFNQNNNGILLDLISGDMEYNISTRSQDWRIITERLNQETLPALKELMAIRDHYGRIKLNASNIKYLIDNNLYPKYKDTLLEMVEESNAEKKNLNVNILESRGKYPEVYKELRQLRLLERPVSGARFTNLFSEKEAAEIAKAYTERKEDVEYIINSFFRYNDEKGFYELRDGINRSSKTPTEKIVAWAKLNNELNGSVVRYFNANNESPARVVLYDVTEKCYRAYANDEATAQKLLDMGITFTELSDKYIDAYKKYPEDFVELMKIYESNNTAMLRQDFILDLLRNGAYSNHKVAFKSLLEHGIPIARIKGDMLKIYDENKEDADLLLQKGVGIDFEKILQSDAFKNNKQEYCDLLDALETPEKYQKNGGHKYMLPVFSINQELIDMYKAGGQEFLKELNSLVAQTFCRVDMPRIINILKNPLYQNHKQAFVDICSVFSFHENNIKEEEINLMENRGITSFALEDNGDAVEYYCQKTDSNVNEVIEKLKNIEKRMFNNPELYINGYIELVSPRKEIARFLRDNNSGLVKLAAVYDKEAIDALMRMRLDEAEDYLDEIDDWSFGDLSLLKRLSQSCNQDGKPFLPKQKIDFINLIAAYKDCRLGMSEFERMLSLADGEGRVDISELNLRLLRSVMEECGFSKEEVASIPAEKLMGWDLRYIHLLSKELSDSFDDADGKFQEQYMRAVNLGNFNQYIHDINNPIGQVNAGTKSEFAGINANYDMWEHVPKDLEVTVKSSDSNTQTLNNVVTTVTRYLVGDAETSDNTNIRSKIGKMFDKRFGQYIHDGKFAIPSEVANNQQKLIEFIEQLLPAKEGEQPHVLDDMWARAQSNLSNPQKAENAQNTLTIKFHLEEELKRLKSMTSDDGSKIKAQKSLDLTVGMWGRDPKKDTFQGNMSTCCIGMNECNGHAMFYYVSNTAFNMITVTDNTTGAVIGNALCYMVENSKGQPYFIVDNIEINNGAKPSNEACIDIRNAITKYAARVAKQVTGKNDTPVYMSGSYNDVPIGDLDTTEELVTLVGDCNRNKIYMDLFGGWWKPEESKTCTLYKLEYDESVFED